jgi:hypothetical protein
MWTLVFVFSVFNYNQNINLSTTVVPSFKTVEACMVAQRALIRQAESKGYPVHLNMCVKGE